MSILDLIRDSDGTMSHTKLWANIASAGGVFAMCSNPTVEMVVSVLGILVGGRAITKAVDTVREVKANVPTVQ